MDVLFKYGALILWMRYSKIEQQLQYLMGGLLLLSLWTQDLSTPPPTWGWATTAIEKWHFFDVLLVHQGILGHTSTGRLPTLGLYTPLLLNWGSNTGSQLGHAS